MPTGQNERAASAAEVEELVPTMGARWHMSDEQRKVVAGFPQYWQSVHDEYAPVFESVKELETLGNGMFEKPVSSPFHEVVRSIAQNVMNSFGALITLVLNGYGSDAMKIARGMFEGAVNVGYLKQYPKKFNDYYDFYWIRQKKLLDYTRKFNPDGLRHVPSKDIEEIESKYSEVAGRFRNRNSWSGLRIKEMAEKVGLGRLYPTFYSFASSMHHVDISGLSLQIEKETWDVAVAPSKKHLDNALLSGHQAALSVLNDYNEIAQLRFDTELATAKKRFNYSISLSLRNTSSLLAQPSRVGGTLGLRSC